MHSLIIPSKFAIAEVLANGQGRVVIGIQDKILEWIEDQDEIFYQGVTDDRKQAVITFPTLTRDEFETLAALFRLNWS
jgi:hypothetical protein